MARNNRGSVGSRDSHRWRGGKSRAQQPLAVSRTAGPPKIRRAEQCLGHRRQHRRSGGEVVIQRPSRPPSRSWLRQSTHRDYLSLRARGKDSRCIQGWGQCVRRSFFRNFVGSCTDRRARGVLSWTPQHRPTSTTPRHPNGGQEAHGRPRSRR